MDVQKNPDAKNIILDRLAMFYGMSEKTLDSIIEDQNAKLDAIDLEEHIKQVFVAPSGIQEVFEKANNDEFSTMTQEDRDTNEALSKELSSLQEELREYYYDENLRNQIIDKFGERCKDFRTRQLNHAVKLLYDLFLSTKIETPAELYTE